jgi:hypothetical protein
MTADSILDDLFHGCALAAFLEQAEAQQGWPDPEATRRRAYQLYEEALAENNRLKGPLPASREDAKLDRIAKRSRGKRATHPS